MTVVTAVVATRDGRSALSRRSPWASRGASGSEKRLSRSSAVAPGSLMRRNLATRTRFSRPLRISSTAANCPVRLMDSRTFSGCVATSKPLTLASPASAFRSVARILTVVVLPAPLEPSRAKMVPGTTSKSTPRSTSSFPYDFLRPCTRIAGPALDRAVMVICLLRGTVPGDCTEAPPEGCRVDPASRSSPFRPGTQIADRPRTSQLGWGEIVYGAVLSAPWPRWRWPQSPVAAGRQRSLSERLPRRGDQWSGTRFCEPLTGISSSPTHR